MVADFGSRSVPRMSDASSALIECGWRSIEYRKIADQLDDLSACGVLMKR